MFSLLKLFSPGMWLGVAIAAAGVFSAGAASGWAVNGWRLESDHRQAMAKAQREYATLADSVREQNAAVEAAQAATAAAMKVRDQALLTAKARNAPIQERVRDVVKYEPTDADDALRYWWEKR